jgi:two-component system sensor histidine kinase HydH
MRLIWAVTSLILTLAMIGVAWVTRARVMQSVRDLDQSQGEVLLTSIRESLRSLPAPPPVSLLDSLLDRHAAGGLTSIAFFGSDNRLIASAGTQSSGPAVNLHRPDTASLPVATAGGRLRTLGFFRPTRDSAGVPVWAPRARGPAASEARSVLMIEFDPILARGLLADADRTFALAALTGTALVAVTLLFWRLAGLYEATQRRNEREQRLAALGEMSAVLAHEIRNPLASLKGNAQLLARRLTSGSAEARKADLVVAEAERLEALTSDLLDFARTGPMDIRPANPAGLLAACIEEVAPDRFEVRSDEPPRSWPLDARRTRLALVNILRNAVQASPPGMKAEVTLSQEGEYLVFAVQDHGEGIRQGDEERLFTPFFTTRTTGTGLGLAVARRIAELHGGTIVASNHGGGALFRMALAAQPLTDGDR